MSRPGPTPCPAIPEVMILSNIIADGKPVGLGDAGQGWHTDMSYSKEIAFANVLFALEDPEARRQGRLANAVCQHACRLRRSAGRLENERLEGKSAIHDFEKFWEMMRQRPGSTRGPLTPEQRAKKPPVAHPIFLTHPITGQDGALLQPRLCDVYRGHGARRKRRNRWISCSSTSCRRSTNIAHEWSEGDVLIWENIGTLHNAIADYGPDEPRYIHRCQVMADKVFSQTFWRSDLQRA